MKEENKEKDSQRDAWYCPPPHLNDTLVIVTVIVIASSCN